MVYFCVWNLYVLFEKCRKKIFRILIKIQTKYELRITQLQTYLKQMHWGSGNSVLKLAQHFNRALYSACKDKAYQDYSQ